MFFILDSTTFFTKLKIPVFYFMFEKNIKVPLLINVSFHLKNRYAKIFLKTFITRVSLGHETSKIAAELMCNGYSHVGM